MSVRIIPLEGIEEVRPGDDLSQVLQVPLAQAGLIPGDIVVVTSKIVSKAEGRLVPEGERSSWIRRETRRVIARRGQLLIARTRHGFVCANAGVDASNVEPGTLALLPEDPDGSAERLRGALISTFGHDELGIVITDTFGRPWREGVVNVAIGSAGIPVVLDLRGTRDDRGRVLETTVVAVADEVAAAAGLVMPKSGRIPAAIVRGLEHLATGRSPGVATDLVRDPTADLFGESPLQALHGLHENPEFGLGDVPSQVVEEALSAGCEVEGPHKIAWRFSVLTTKAAMRVLSNALKNSRDVGERVLDRAATVIVLWWDETAGGPDADRLEPESNLWILRGGRLVQNVMLAVHAQGYVAGWDSAVAALPQATRAALGAPEHWIPFGAVAIGPPPSRSLAPRSPPDWRSVTSWSEPET